MAEEKKGRIYRVRNKKTGEVRYGRAMTNISAKGAVAADMLEAEIATADVMLDDGITKDKVENWLSEQTETLPLAEPRSDETQPETPDEAAKPKPIRSKK